MADPRFEFIAEGLTDDHYGVTIMPKSLSAHRKCKMCEEITPKTVVEVFSNYIGDVGFKHNKTLAVCSGCGDISIV